MGLTTMPPMFTLAAPHTCTGSKTKTSKPTLSSTPLHALLTLSRTLLNPSARASARDLADIQSRLRRLRAYVATNTLTQAEYDAYCARITAALERKETAPCEARAKILALEDALALIAEEDEDEDEGVVGSGSSPFGGLEVGERTMRGVGERPPTRGKGAERGVRASVRRGRGRLLRRWSGSSSGAEPAALGRGIRCAVGSIPALPAAVEEGEGSVFRDGRRTASAPASLPPRASEVWPFDSVLKRGGRLRREEWFGLGEFEFEREGAEGAFAIDVGVGAVGVGVVGVGVEGERP